MFSWNTLENRGSGVKSVVMYKILNDHTAPGLRGSFVTKKIDQTNYRLRNAATDLALPKPKREFLKMSFKYSGAMLWNQLSVERKLEESLHSFKTIVGRWHAKFICLYIYHLLLYIFNLCAFVFSSCSFFNGFKSNTPTWKSALSWWGYRVDFEFK